MSNTLMSLYLIVMLASQSTALDGQPPSANAYTSAVKTVYEMPHTASAASSTPAASLKDMETKEEDPAKNKIGQTDIEAENIDFVAELKKLGYYKEESDDPDLKVRNAIIRFQADHNLDVDGIWGDQSLVALKNRIKDKTFAYPDKVSALPTEGKWITINKTRRILTLYQNMTVIKKYPIAVGNPPTLTPDGKHTVVVKVVDPDWGGGGYAKSVKGGTPENPLGYRWIGLSLNGGGDYGVHGNNSPYSIGLDISHGCVRMINSDVAELFEIVPLNTPIWINSEEDLKKWGIEQPMYSLNQ